MKNILTHLAVLLSCTAFAQGNLQFNQTIKITNTQVTVPSGKVWKLENIYGEEARFNLCLSVNSSANHELERIRCGYTSETWQALRVSYYTIAKMIVDGKTIPCRIGGLKNGSYDNFTGANCDVQQTSRTADWSCANIPSDPNLFPMWLGPGTTIQTGGPNTFVSGLEFNLVP
jgi:hypothetical protein